MRRIELIAGQLRVAAPFLPLVLLLGFLSCTFASEVLHRVRDYKLVLPRCVLRRLALFTFFSQRA